MSDLFVHQTNQLMPSEKLKFLPWESLVMFNSVDTGRPSSSEEGLEARFQKSLPFQMFYI